jgi:hypothetical protein
MKEFVCRYWSLFVMLILLGIAFLAFSNPPWYQQYAALVWAAAALLTILFWANRDKDQEK